MQQDSLSHKQVEIVRLWPKSSHLGFMSLEKSYIMFIRQQYNDQCSVFWLSSKNQTFVLYAALIQANPVRSTVPPDQLHCFLKWLQQNIGKWGHVAGLWPLATFFSWRGRTLVSDIIEMQPMCRLHSQVCCLHALENWFRNELSGVLVPLHSASLGLILIELWRPLAFYGIELIQKFNFLSYT